jgi:hypothetical protein
MVTHERTVSRALTIGVALRLVKAPYGWYDPRLFAMPSSPPPRPAPRVRTCPDCGGILQSIEPERLTSAEVAATDERTDPVPGGQCLLCGYEEPAGTSVLSADTR